MVELPPQQSSTFSLGSLKLIAKHYNNTYAHSKTQKIKLNSGKQAIWEKVYDLVVDQSLITLSPNDIPLKTRSNRYSDRDLHFLFQLWQNNLGSSQFTFGGIYSCVSLWSPTDRNYTAITAAFIRIPGAVSSKPGPLRLILVDHKKRRVRYWCPEAKSPARIGIVLASLQGYQFKYNKNCIGKNKPSRNKSGAVDELVKYLGQR